MSSNKCNTMDHHARAEFLKSNFGSFCYNGGNEGVCVLTLERGTSHLKLVDNAID